MAICIYCGDKVGIVCDDCASSAQERDKLNAKLATARTALEQIANCFCPDCMGYALAVKALKDTE